MSQAIAPMVIGMLAGAGVFGLAALLLHTRDVVARRVRRWWAKRAIRKQLEVLRGGKPIPVFTSAGELAQRQPRPPVRSLRARGDDDAA